MVLNTGPLDWESRTVTTRPLLHKFLEYALLYQSNLFQVNWSLHLFYEVSLYVNLPYIRTVAMAGNVLPATTWICWINYRNRYVRLLMLRVLSL